MRRTKEDANVTRQQLLNAGLNVFSEKGYAAAKLSEIAEEAGGMERGEIRQDIEAEVIISMFATLFRGYGFMLSHEDVMPFFRKKKHSQEHGTTL